MTSSTKRNGSIAHFSKNTIKPMTDSVFLIVNLK